MSTIRDLEHGVFSTLMLRDTLSRLDAEGIAPGVTGDVNPTIEPLARDFSPRIRREAEDMQQVFVLFFSLENAVRELIAQRLAERHRANWWEDRVPSKIRDHVTGLQAKEAKTKYHAKRASTPIGYTTFGQLVQIIIANWADFTDLFPDQAWLTSRFNDLEVSRNIIMHSNQLPEGEIDRIRSAVRDWLSQVG
jgi:hypothetical protein